MWGKSLRNMRKRTKLQLALTKHRKGMPRACANTRAGGYKWTHAMLLGVGDLNYERGHSQTKRLQPRKGRCHPIQKKIRRITTREIGRRFLEGTAPHRRKIWLHGRKSYYTLRYVRFSDATNATTMQINGGSRVHGMSPLPTIGRKELKSVSGGIPTEVQGAESKKKLPRPNYAPETIRRENAEGSDAHMIAAIL